MNQNLRGKLIRVLDVLRTSDVTKPVADIQQIFYLIFLKLLDEEESIRLQNESRTVNESNSNDSLIYQGQSERYRWSKWRSKRGEELLDFVNNSVFPYMASLALEERQVAEYFRDAELKIDDPNILKQLVKVIDDIDFTQLSTDIRGDIFEFLLTHLESPTNKYLIQIPRQIRHFMVEMVDPNIDDTIFDPSCGTGGFLADSVEHILAKYTAKPKEVPIYGEEWLEKRGQSIEDAKNDFPTLQTYYKGAGENIPDWGVLERSIYGLDVSRRMVRFTIINLILHGLYHSKVKRADTYFRMGGLFGSDHSRKYSVILSHSPSLFNARLRKNEPHILSYLMNALAPGGRCGIIVGEHVLFSPKPNYNELRQKIVEDYDLLAVVSLPVGVFNPISMVKLSVLVIQRPVVENQKTKKAKQEKKVWFYNILADGFDSNRDPKANRHEAPEENDIPNLLKQWDLYKKSGFETPLGVESRTLLDEKSEEPRYWWTTTENIADNGYNLVAKRYKPPIAIVLAEKDPAILIRETLAIERDIAIDLNKLLQEVEIDQ